MFVCLLLSILHLAVGLVQKETGLNAQTTSQNGASIIHNDLTSTISGTNYNIMLQSEDNDIGYDIKLALNKSWSFHPTITSSIILTMNGNTPYPDKDTDLLFVFSVNDMQYFSFFVHLDNNHNIKSRLYPCISIENMTTSVSEWISNSTIKSRWDRISNNNQWLSINDWNKQVLWPLKFIITNHPINNQIIFQLYHNTTQTYATGYVFENNIFTPNKPIDIYFMGDSVGEQMTISSLNVQLNYNQTNNPTININPTAHLIGDTLGMNYSISLIIGFKYTFSIVDVNAITRILQQIIIISANDNCKEMVKQSITTEANMTIINITIYLCDKFTQNQFLSAVYDGNLQRDIIININKEIQHMEIMPNKTWIEVNGVDINILLFTNSTQTIDITNTNNSKKSFTDFYIFWMIIFITITILAFCAFLSYLKMSVNKKEKKLKNVLNNNQSEIQQHINLTLASSIHHISKIEASYDNHSPHFIRQNSSKLYKMRKYNKPKTVSAASVSIPSTNKSNHLNAPTSPISPRLYKTRGISEDIYDQNNTLTTSGETSHDELYYKVVIPSHTLPKLSMTSHMNSNSYPNFVSPPTSVTISPDQTIVTVQQSHIYKLPNRQITKRQWL